MLFVKFASLHNIDHESVFWLFIYFCEHVFRIKKFTMTKSAMVAPCSFYGVLQESNVDER